MKRESRRDNILLDYSARRSVEGSSGSPVTSSDDIDFKDVFGGPPRRFSYHETTRYSSDGAMDVMETARSRSLNSGKPVFGERSSSVNRRTHQSNDFYDDIFQGVKSRSGSGSTSMGSYEPFGTSLPAQLSLPSAASNRIVDNTTLASTSTFKKKEDTSNGISSSKYSLSRFSSQAEPGHDLTSNGQQSNCTRPLLNEASPRNEESSYVSKSDGIRSRRGPKRDSEITEASNDIKHPHFSIHKWEGGEVPVVMHSPDGLSLKADENPYNLHEISTSEKTRKEVSMVTEKPPKPVPKTLHSFLQDNSEAQDDKDITTKTGRKVNAVKATKVFGSNVGTSNNKVKKHVEKKIESKSTEVNQGSNQRSSNIPEGNIKRSGVRGKVKDFVKKFNQETNSKPKSNLNCGSQSFRSEGKVNCIGVDSSSLSTSNIDAVMHLSNLDTMLDALFELDENAEQQESHQSPVKSTFFTTTENSSLQNGASPCSESIPDESEVSGDKVEDHFQEKTMMKDLFDNQVELPPISKDLKAKALDAEILKWSTGKEGNIRSLISTLQYVLWAESGWKPVPLVDIIELNAVKKSYQKVLLCLHPDKLQQKGADSHQKYVAEKVFEILQEAWDHFNSLDPL